MSEWEHLSPMQQARVEALQAARAVLAARTPITTAAVSAVDLVSLGSWILTGADPWLTEAEPDEE